jgi:ribosomal protein S18 acetylase RimI-like enzyme
MSMYGDYIKEHRGDGIIEGDYGFATYRFLNEGNSVYIVDIYTTPDFRRTALASELADKIAEIGRAHGAKEMLGSVVPSANNSTQSLEILLKYGMQLLSCEHDLIIFRKEI